MRKEKPVLVLLITTLFVIVSSFPFASVVFAATCGGTNQPSCNGLFASSTGCGTASTKATSYPASTRLELRRSSDCSTFWARATNMDGTGRNMWGVATIKPYDSYTTYSGGAIAVGQMIASRQRYSTASGTAGFNACGYFGLTQISSPAPYNAACAPYP